MRLFGKVDGQRDRHDRPFTFRGLPFDIAWRPPVVDPGAGGADFRSIFTAAPRLGLTVYEYPGGPLVGDWTRAQGVTVETGEHGFAVLRGFLPATEMESFRVYYAERPFHLLLSDGLNIIFEGRIEDVTIQAKGFTFTAFGYWRALSDVPYSGLFVDDALGRWYVLPPEEVDASLPDRYSADNNNRLYLAPNGGETFGASTAWGVFGYAVPMGSERLITEVSFHYKLKGPSPWRVRFDRRDENWALLSTEWVLDGAATIQEGNVTETFAGCAAVTFSLFYNAADTAFAGESGDVYMRITLPVVKTVAGTITAKIIADELVAYVSGINPSQLSDSTAEVGDPGLALGAEAYEDAVPADILTGLGGLGGSETPPVRWTAAVWDKRRLRFAPVGQGGRVWYVDVLEFQLERSLDDVANQVYASFKGPHSSTARTDIAADEAAVRRHGFVRRMSVRVESSSETVAENLRDLLLSEKARAKPRAQIVTRGVVDASGISHPLYSVRAGDMLVLRNLPANTFGGIDEVRSFRLASTRYDCDTDTLTPTPADSLMTLDIVVARRERGIT